MTSNQVLATAFVFERCRGLPLGSYELNEIQEQGLDDVDPELLMRNLTTLVMTFDEGENQERSQVYWVLGKKRDRALIPFFRQQLGAELSRDMNAVYQIMIALQDLDAPGLEVSCGGYSSQDEEWNREVAARYLKTST